VFGLGIGIFIVLVLIAFGHRSESISTGIMWFGIFIGLLVASVVPGLPNNVHDFVKNTITSVQNIDTNK
jgi:hypothetical protein